MNTSTVLVVDDDPGSLNALIEYLHRSGFETMVAPNGERALRQLTRAQADIILLDVLMPGIDGFETCRRLKEQDTTRDIPVIFMTALSDTVDKVKGFELGGVDYLTKPIQFEEVLARLNAHLTIRQLQQQLRRENERFQQLAEATFEGVIIHNEGCILDVNQAVVHMFGFHPDELRGMRVADLLPRNVRKLTEEKIQTRDERPYETEGLRQDATRFPLEIQMKTMPYEGRDVMVAAVRDITWRKKMEQEQALLRKENVTLRSTIRDRYKFGGIIGRSAVMQDVYQSIVNASASDMNVVIYGESGTGKELAARTIHQLSERKDQAFVAVNCGAVAESLFEREFFGHRKGAFTGATADKPGYLDRAHTGTLFLDEIGELKPALQVKLLRVLQEKEYTPVGDTRSKTADIRIIAATNKDLKELVRQGAVREDFFYRIRVIVINLPPLRSRKEDIPLLVEHFLEQYGKDGKISPIPGHIVEMLSAYDWPGNVRELQNELQRYLAEQRLEFIGDLQVEAGTDTSMMQIESNLSQLGLRKTLDEIEKRLIAQKLAQNQGHTAKTAEMLAIPLRTLQRKIQKYGL